MCCTVLAALASGCDRSGSGGTVPSGNSISETTPAPPPGTAAAAARRTSELGDATPASVPDTAPATAQPEAELDGKTLRLTGITMTVPDGWVERPVEPGPMAAKAVFAIPSGDGSGDEGSVRITHYPGMKGKNDLNINRWLAQATRDDGTPTSRDEAKIEREEWGKIHLTILDVRGNVKATMRGTAQPGGRMIAAIVDHPQGPHFIVATGKAALITKSEADILAFLHSAKVQ